MTWTLIRPPGRAPRRRRRRRPGSTPHRRPPASRSTRWRRSCPDVAVVMQLDVDAVGEAGCGDPLAGQVVLRLRDGDASSRGSPARRRRTARSRPSRCRSRGRDCPGSRPASSAMRRYFDALGVGERLVRMSRRERSSRSSSRPARAGRSRCRGRSARRCCGETRFACCGCGGGRWSAPRLGRDPPPARRTGPARGGWRPPSEMSATRSGLDQRPSTIGLAAADLTAEEHPSERVEVMDVHLPAQRGRRFAEDPPRAVRELDASGSPSGCATPPPDRRCPAMPREQRFDGRGQSLQPDGRRSPGHLRMTVEADAATPQPPGMEMDGRDRLLGREGDAHQQPGEHAIGQGSTLEHAAWR